MELRGCQELVIMLSPRARLTSLFEMLRAQMSPPMRRRLSTLWSRSRSRMSSMHSVSRDAGVQRSMPRLSCPPTLGTWWRGGTERRGRDDGNAAMSRRADEQIASKAIACHVTAGCTPQFALVSTCSTCSHPVHNPQPPTPNPVRHRVVTADRVRAPFDNSCEAATPPPYVRVRHDF